MLALPEWLSNAPFIKMGAFLIQNDSNLTPSECTIRQIKDLGSVQASAAQPGVDLLDRDVVVISSYTYITQAIFCRITRVVAATGVLVIGAPLGVLWHTGATIYHALGSIRNGRHLTPLEQHAVSLAQDFAASLPTFAFLVSKFGTTQGIILALQSGSIMVVSPAVFVLMVTTFVGFVEFIGLFALFFLPPEALSYPFGFTHAVLMKTRLGLVGEQGELLTPGRETDTFDYFDWDHSQFRGMLSDLRKKNSAAWEKEIQKIFQELPLILSNPQADKFSKHPENLLAYLKNNSLSNTRAWDQLQKFTDTELSLRDCLKVLFLDETIPSLFFLEHRLAVFFKYFLIENPSKRDFKFQLQEFRFNYQREHKKSYCEEFRELFSEDILEVFDRIYQFFIPENPSLDLEQIQKSVSSATNPYAVLGLRIADPNWEQARPGLSCSVDPKLYDLIQAAKKVIEENPPLQPAFKEAPVAD